MKKIFFPHEKLRVYQKSLEFIDIVEEIITSAERKSSIYDQLERASISIVLNIAEGNGKYTCRDRNRFFDISIGSAFECSACIDILFRKGKITENQHEKARENLKAVADMIYGLVKSSESRVYKAGEKYGAD